MAIFNEFPNSCKLLHQHDPVVYLLGPDPRD
jgi:hypothetical protein